MPIQDLFTIKQKVNTIGVVAYNQKIMDFEQIVTA
jgi:hypothetical protein